jgi:hypothetical protein
MGPECNIGSWKDLLVLIPKEAVQGKKTHQGKAHYLEASFIFSLLDESILFD